MFYPKLLLPERYNIIQALSPGGMSEVWLAKDTKLERCCIYKKLAYF